MKKFALVMFFSMIIATFVGFNYLLWERENREKDIKSLQNISTSNSITINALNRQLENTENTLKSQNDNINKLSDENASLKEDLKSLNQDNNKINETINRKNEIIDFLYSNQSELITVPIIEWAEHINSEDFESAYLTLYASKESDKKYFIEFLNQYENTVKGIEVESVEYYSNSSYEFDGENVENLLDESLIFEGDLFFLVKLNVNLIQDNAKNSELFVEGDNDRIFGLVYDIEEEKWYIGNIFKTL